MTTSNTHRTTLDMPRRSSSPVTDEDERPDEAMDIPYGQLSDPNLCPANNAHQSFTRCRWASICGWPFVHQKHQQPKLPLPDLRSSLSSHANNSATHPHSMNLPAQTVFAANPSPMTYPLVDGDLSHVPEELQDPDDKSNRAARGQDNEHAAHVAHPQFGRAVRCTRSLQFAAAWNGTERVSWGDKVANSLSVSLFQSATLTTYLPSFQNLVFNWCRRPSSCIFSTAPLIAVR